MRSIKRGALALILVLGGLGTLGAAPARAGGYRGGSPHGGGSRGTPFSTGGTSGGGFPGGVGYRGFSHGGAFARGGYGYGYGFSRFPNVGPFPPFPIPGRPAHCGPRRPW